MKTNIVHETEIRASVETGVIVEGTVVKLGLDVHARQITVSRQLGDCTPQPAQMFTKERLLGWVRKMVEAGAVVHSCYEASVMGYTLHRELTALGVGNLVVAPKQLSGPKRQKTDALDARALVDALDRWLRGNRDAFSVVRVPTSEEEQARAQARLRDHLGRMRRMAEGRGRSLLLAHGCAAEKYWWRKARWEALQAKLPEWLRLLVAQWQAVARDFDERERALRAQLEAAAPADLPRGIGALTWVILAREICNWARFKNRRQVASYTGLCPGVHTSDGRGREGSINRCGNRHVRTALVELVWRLARWQPDYKPVRLLVDKTALSGRRRRKLAVAAARRLAIDLWRLATKQTTPEKIGLNAAFVP
jgi:transposase